MRTPDHDSEMRDSNMRDSDLRDSDLRDSDLRDSDMRDSDLRPMTGDGADTLDPSYDMPGPSTTRPADRPAGGGTDHDPLLDEPMHADSTQADPGRGRAGEPADRSLNGGGRDRDAMVASAGTDADGREQLVAADRAESYGSRWDAVKGTFVDEPREAVAQADALVGELLQELEQLFKEQRRNIDQSLDSDETSTEDLRVALRRYRSFFDRLLTL